jgi:aspartate/methionine/tyrosine aminotransferase
MSGTYAKPSRLAARWAGFGTSIFTEMTELARARGAVNLAQGFPDFHGPDELLRAIAQHVETSHHQYAPGNGEERLRRAVARFVASTTGVERDWATEVTITTGATEAIYSTVNAFVNPGDRVVVFEPLYDSYAQAVAQAGGVLVPIRLHAPDATDPTWHVDWAAFDRARDAGFALLILNSPHNPTGKVFAEEELARIAAAVRAADAVALCDEVYEQMTYDGARHVSLSSRPDMRDHVVRISSAAKTFGFTGLKVGWATASRELTAAVRLVHQATVFSTNPFLQTAIAQVLEDDAWMTQYLADLRATYKDKRDFLTHALRGAGFDVPAVLGTYFVMASFARLAPELTDIEMTRRLVEEKGVAAIPPSVFYANPPGPLPWLRFAFCKKDETLALAAQRLTGAQARP